ncbi:hypothetical protein CY34DRAFT_506156 [Suillus luteus UH-Slu-Lm8-n1]|uniref:Uncharacterized protein n=1 Tax=Suillus luteus UH-Slu-Lm8-n1 TaxID=930992 RepID=A0A0C9ZGS3_9AGAM|nr:hypothetical protein CY34DRAFT_506156 [Suillus luteus UH-Slu-Lm8-n1]
MLEIVGAPFKGHTKLVNGLALSFDQALLATASFDDTIKLLVLSPDSRQLAYTTSTHDDNNIYICDIPPGILAQNIARTKSNLDNLLHCRDLRLQTNRSNPLSLDSPNSFASLLARMHYALVGRINLVIP